MLHNAKDSELRARAARVVPGGMWGHQNAANLPEGYPQFFSGAQGCRIRDVDGNEYIDFMCSWGPVLLGHHHPEVEAAAARQAALGDCQNGPGEAMVELAELLVDTIPHADWVQFQKNGTDATTMGANVRTMGTKRASTMVFAPCLSKKTVAFCTYACLKMRESGRLNNAGPTRRPNT